MGQVPEPRSERPVSFATTQAQRAVELANVTEKELDEIRHEAVQNAVAALLAGQYIEARFQIRNGVRDAHELDMKANARFPDPVIVRRNFWRAVEAYS